MSVLRREGETDYFLEEDAHSVWITIGNISVYLRRADEGVAVDLYPLGHELHDSLAGTWALFSESEESLEDEREYRDDRRGAVEDREDAGRQPHGNEEGTTGGSL